MPGVTLNPKQENCPQDLTGDTKNIIRVVTITGHQKANLLGAPTGRSRWDGTAKVKKKQDRLGADARAPLRDNFRGQKNGLAKLNRLEAETSPWPMPNFGIRLKHRLSVGCVTRGFQF